MRFVWGNIGWGWRMYGVMQTKVRPMWFLGFSTQHIEASAPPKRRTTFNSPLMAAKVLSEG